MNKGLDRKIGFCHDGSVAERRKGQKMVDTKTVIDRSIDAWKKILKESLQRGNGLGITDRLVIWFGLIFAQPLATFSALIDFRWFALNRLLNKIGRKMGAPHTFPEHEEEREKFINNIVMIFFEAASWKIGLPKCKMKKWAKNNFSWSMYANQVSNEEYWS